MFTATIALSYLPILPTVLTLSVGQPVLCGLQRCEIGLMVFSLESCHYVRHTIAPSSSSTNIADRPISMGRGDVSNNAGGFPALRSQKTSVCGYHQPSLGL